ncbi:ATP-binding protein, partial [Candidatus Uhrbacteria bacterium]|nr:ATP-binding protein [Candidatus Uhrbacteria bacterium]
NPCPCGNYGSKIKQCLCSLGSVMKYHKKISGPLIDRIDVFVDVPPVDGDKLMTPSREHAMDSALLREKVEKARARQRERFSGEGITTNAEMSSSRVERCCRLDVQAEQLMKMALEKLALSARSYFRVLKVARTIADLDGCDDITHEHVAESLQYRPRAITEYS